jgi:hypothetical protein
MVGHKRSKGMKVFLIGMCVIAFGTRLQAQKTENERLNGVYLTLDDYLHHHLTHSFVSKTKGFHLRFPNNSRIKLKTPDSTYEYDLTQIYGYCEEGKNWCYRSGQLVEVIGYQFVEFVSYEGLWLYRRHEWSESGNSYTYYFSKSSTGELSWFTRKKFRDAFKDDSNFLNLLSKVKWNRLLYKSSKTGEPLLLEIYATSHQLDFSFKE